MEAVWADDAPMLRAKTGGGRTGRKLGAGIEAQDFCGLVLSYAIARRV